MKIYKRKEVVGKKERKNEMPVKNKQNKRILWQAKKRKKDVYLAELKNRRKVCLSAFKDAYRIPCLHLIPCHSDTIPK